MPEISEKLEWTTRVPVFRNPIILKQLGIAIGIPFGILIFILIVTKAYYALGLIAVLFLFTYLFIRLVWGGKYDVGFELNRTGIRNYTLTKQSNKNRVINILAVVTGLLSGKPAVAGAGILAQSRQDVLIRWSNIRKVRFYPENQTVIIKGGFAENIAVFCTSENYAEVAAFIQLKFQNKQIIQ
ncbi:MAG: hypothetical protein K0M50_13340 [Prolixibacteraceae bacterium]|nr:hypothetical protein [Prolixibacteraceae bacterium]